MTELLTVDVSHQVRSFVVVPLRVHEQEFGVLSVTAAETGRFDQGDVDLLTAVASHVALAIDRAESFQTIEDLSRGLEDKVRVRTEQLRVANDDLQAAYRATLETLGSALYGLVASGIGLFNESILAERGFAPEIYYRALAVTAAWPCRSSSRARIGVTEAGVIAGAVDGADGGGGSPCSSA